MGIFHANVQYLGPGSTTREPQHMEFLWVRWFGYDFSQLGGFEMRRLHCVGFVPEDSSGAFSFLDPSVVIRGVHLIPGFAHGRIEHSMGATCLRKYQTEEDDNDWQYLYVNM